MLHCELVIHELFYLCLVFLETCRSLDRGKFLLILARRFIVCTRHANARQTVFQFHLLFDEGIPCGNRLDFSIGKHRLVHVLGCTHGTLGCHGLRDVLLLVLHCLPEIGVERALRDVAEDLYLLVFIAWTHDAPHALLKIGRTPGHGKIVLGDELVLYIRTYAERSRRA